MTCWCRKSNKKKEKRSRRRGRGARTSRSDKGRHTSIEPIICMLIFIVQSSSEKCAPVSNMAPTWYPSKQRGNHRRLPIVITFTFIIHRSSCSDWIIGSAGIGGSIQLLIPHLICNVDEFVLGSQVMDVVLEPRNSFWLTFWVRSWIFVWLGWAMASCDQRDTLTGVTPHSSIAAKPNQLDRSNQLVWCSARLGSIGRSIGPISWGPSAGYVHGPPSCKLSRSPLLLRDNFKLECCWTWETELYIE